LPILFSDPGELLVLGLVAAISFALSYFGASVGLVLGQLRLPALVYWLGSPIVGAATSLAISAVAALVGAARHAREGRVSLRLMATIGAPSALGAFLTARSAAEFDPQVVRGAIGIALLVTAAFMMRKGAREWSDVEADQPYPATPGRIAAEVTVGGALGAVAALVGLLLGTLRLPVMLRLGVPTAQAVGTNMAIGALTGVVAATTTFSEGHVDVVAFAVIAPTTVLGAFLGASATGRMQKQTLRTLIAVTLVVIGGWMIVDVWTV
jgi:uncharacterized membrane protein YfcA